MNETTILPDGSAFNTAIIMSNDEAMALPLNKRPLCYRISNEMYMAVWEAIGLATGCWKKLPENSEIDTYKASNIVVDLCFKIAEELEKK